MHAGIILCATIGHRWHVDDTSADPTPTICCSRCGRRQQPNVQTAFDRRLGSETGRDRSVGPFGRGR